MNNSEPWVDSRVLPVVTLDDVSKAVAVGQALVTGGLTVIEVTFRRPDAEQAVAALSSVAELSVGAGTVLSAAQVDRAVDAGATFVVSPGFDDAVVAQARARQVPVLPGVATPTEVQRALTAGLSTVKLFPAEPLGGVRWLRALAAPFGQLRFVPTGGIAEAQLAEYLAEPSVAAVGGSWLVPPDRVAAGDWDAIVHAARRAATVAAGALR